ncbi:uroporphyrinogen-III synthase [Gymnodinialimonas sp. 2305UL16-5]|uniref:uroporphyrinogen-III synthase n=1 Tax=Gymnodinialimonas mytili TaxID=3126503 RepID=UPI0030AC7C01
MAVYSPPTLLLTRPRAGSERFAASLTGFDVVIAPLMEIVGTGAAIDLTDVRGMVLTSQNALPFLPDCTPPAYCVGPTTTAAALAHGLKAQQVGMDADTLVAMLTQMAPETPLLHPHGVHSRGHVATRLTEAGIATWEVAIYDQRPLPPDDTFAKALGAKDLILPVFSPRSAKLLAGAIPSLPKDARVVAISAAAAAELPPSWAEQIRIADAPNGRAMRAALHQAARRDKILRNSP